MTLLAILSVAIGPIATALWLRARAECRELRAQLFAEPLVLAEEVAELRLVNEELRAVLAGRRPNV